MGPALDLDSGCSADRGRAEHERESVRVEVSLQHVSGKGNVYRAVDRFELCRREEPETEFLGQKSRTYERQGADH